MHRTTMLPFLRLTFIALACTTTAANAQQRSGAAPDAYPTKPIRLIVGYSPGGGSDVTARAVAHKMTSALGQTIVVDNRPGANGTIAMEIAARAMPDGYTLLLAAGGDLASAHVRKKVSYDVATAYEPITQLTSQYYLLLVTPKLPVKSVADVIAYAKSKRGALSFGSSGIGSAGHAGLEYIKAAADVDIIHVPYKGIGPALNDMIGGQLHLAFASTISGVPHVKSGRLRALAVTSARRAKAFPDLPSVSESVPGFDLTNWYGLFALARTPATIVLALQREASAAVRSAELQAQFSASGAEAAASSSPTEFKKTLVNELEKWEKFMRLPAFAESLH